MAIPDFQECMRPFLVALEKGQVHHFNDAYDYVCEFFNVSDEEKRKLLPSGKQRIVKSRCSWARTYMKKAGLLTSPKRGYVQITESGKTALIDRTDNINVKYLKKISSEFVNFHTAKPKVLGANKIEVNFDSADPIERIEQAYAEIESNLVADLLQIIKDQSPVFLEGLVVKLMHSMGYGGWSQDSGNTTQYTADGGIDGFINEDPLGLETIYLQAKRFSNNSVGRPDIQSFVGALEMKRARKGVFITTSKFSSEAMEYIKMIEKKVILIDGEQLARLMIFNDLGVTLKDSYEIKSIDTDFFIDD